MVRKRHSAGLLFGVCLAAALCHGQDLTPRAYVITPVHSNAVILTYDFSDGGVLFDNSVPITNATATLDVAILSYDHSLSLFGRSANITVSLPTLPRQISRQRNQAVPFRPPGFVLSFIREYQGWTGVVREGVRILASEDNLRHES